MEEVRDVGSRALVAVYRFEREGQERLVMAYRSLENRYLMKDDPNSEMRPEIGSEREPVKRRPLCSIGQEVIS